MKGKGQGWVQQGRLQRHQINISRLPALHVGYNCFYRQHKTCSG